MEMCVLTRGAAAAAPLGALRGGAARRAAAGTGQAEGGQGQAGHAAGVAGAQGGVKET